MKARACASLPSVYGVEIENSEPEGVPDTTYRLPVDKKTITSPSARKERKSSVVEIVADALVSTRVPGRRFGSPASSN